MADITPQARARLEQIARRPRREPDYLTDDEARVMATIGAHRARHAGEAWAEEAAGFVGTTEDGA